MNLNNLSIRTKLQFIVIIAVMILFSIGIFNLTIQKQQNYEHRKNGIRTSIDIVKTLVHHYISLESGTGTLEAQEQALEH